MIEINQLDLFSGIGGFHLGFERAGYKVNSYFSEIDKSPLEVLAKTLVWLENVKGWEENDQALSLRQYDSSANADHEFLCGKMLKEHSAQMMAKILRQSSSPLPTLGAIDLNGNCLIHRGFYPKIESGYTLSDILQSPNEVGEEYFLSKDQEKRVTNHPRNKIVKA